MMNGERSGVTDERKNLENYDSPFVCDCISNVGASRGSSRTVTFLLVLTGVRSTDEALHSQRNDGMFHTTCPTGCPAPV